MSLYPVADIFSQCAVMPTVIIILFCQSVYA